MKASTKGAILSGFGFPGVGQIMLGRKGIGIGFIVVTSAAIVALVYSVAQRIPLLLDKLIPEMERGTLTLAMIFQETHRMTTAAGTLVENVSLWVIVLCWVLSPGHAYITGRKMEEDSGGENSQK